MKRSAGFTLIEVLIAVSLTAIVLSSIYGVLTSVFVARERVLAESETSQIGRVLFERLGRELRGAWQPQQPPPPAPQVKLFFEAGLDRDGQPELRFATASTTLAATGRGGMAALRYGLQPMPEGPSDRLYLVRSEEPYHLRDRLDAGSYPLTGNVKSVTWRFYGANGWVDSWSAAQSNSLPQLVEMTVILLDKDNRETVLRGTFDLP
jgi:general secretion pathway protein J